MSTALDKISIVTSLLPKVLIEEFELEGEGKKLGESQMCAISQFIVNVVLGTLKALTYKKYKLLDANPGDGGCQCRSLELYRISFLDLKKECETLDGTIKKIRGLLNERQSVNGIKSTPIYFFQTHFLALTTSKELEYLFHCYVSTVLRTPYQKLENGVILTKSDVSKLSVLSEKITQLDKVCRKKIVEGNQKTLSMLSVQATFVSAMQIVSLDTLEKKRVVTMLSEEHVHLYTPDSQYESKAFGCLFYEIKVLLCRLKEENCLICLKSIVAKGTNEHCFLQSKVSGKDFEILDKESVISYQQTTPLVVFEAVFNDKTEHVIKKISEYGFSEIILIEAANSAPYEPTSTLKDVKDVAAVEEIQMYRDRGLKREKVFSLDHIYLNTLVNEIIIKK